MPYIDSEFLKKKIFPYGMADNGNYGINAKSVMVAIENAPEIDAVEVIRCKNCTKGLIREGAKFPILWCKKWENIMTFDDFCSYGERKTDV